MSVESDIFNLLKGLVNGRVYPDVAPAGAEAPYVAYQQVGGASVGYIGNEVPTIKNGRFQIAVWAKTRAQASTLILQIETALLTATVFQAKPVGAPVSVYEQDTSMYGSSQDFSIWSDR